jgi:OOP family OmpA-OmpF porin
MLFVALSPAASAQEAQPRWYVGAEFGQAHGEASESDLSSALAAAGYDVTAQYDDRTRKAWGVHAGYWVLPYVGVRAAYENLGDVSTTIRGTVADVDQLLAELARVHPRAATGGELAVVGRYPVLASLVPRLAVTGKAGVWLWDSKYTFTDSSGTTARANDDGTDLVLGAGVEYSPAERWALNLDWTRYRLDSETIQSLGVGVSFRF